MQLGPNLKFQCSCCSEDVYFSVMEISKILTCQHCSLEYEFSEDLLKKMEKFIDLCLQIQKSKDILGCSSVTVEVAQEKAVIPFNFLLTCFPVSLDLQVNGKTLSIQFLMKLNEDQLNKKNYCKL